ncbi:MAG: hypothetical protein P8M16_01540 [Acidimicrobiales bacterium]|nr:hypothetical protein [Acidimicrobiales bacterium]
MTAPSYVPQSAVRSTERAYLSPRRRLGSWHADRPGEVTEGQPRGEGLGSQGPDQGYALRLARGFTTQLRLGVNEHAADVIAGCVSVALKRAALFGRAPMVADLELAFRIFGFLDEIPTGNRLDERRHLFAEASHHHHYAEVRRIADRVPEGVLVLGVAAACDAFII